MNKNIAIAAMSAVLVLVGAGCGQTGVGPADEAANVGRADSRTAGEDQRGPGSSRGYGIGFGDGSGQGARREITERNCLADECLEVAGVEYPVGTLNDAAKEALNAALQDEYKARATYSAIIDKLGMVRPFSMIVRAEDQHINALKALFDRYGLAIPEAAPLDPQVSDSLAEMCAVGVEAEIANAALYRERLLPAVQDHEDIVFVFTNLMSASEEKHLPAFERCAGR